MPQRVMPEVPSNMQEGLAHLELEATNPPPHRMSTSSVTTMNAFQTPQLNQSNPVFQNNQRNSGPGFTTSYLHTNASAYQGISRSGYGGSSDEPKFSPFPKLRDPGQNVPLSDEDKEEVLDRARPIILKTTDPEMQLAWAQDALSWVEVASQSASRQTEGQNGRSITPKVEHQLKEDALSIVRFLAEQQHPKAEFMKGMWLEFGKFGYRIDKKEAFGCYKRAAERGYARAEYRIGMQYENSNNSTKAVEHYRKGVAMHDSASNYRLGMMTLLGQHGMQQDYRRGADLIRFAAETADENAPQGAYVYGMLLARELPNINVPEQVVPFDLNEARVYIEKAAYLGFAKAQLKMAQAYELCQLGLEFEPALSLHYNALASRQGEADADMSISKWFLCGYEGIFEKNEELAFSYAQRAAQGKLPTAEFALGYFYEIGMYVPVDLKESERWYTKAAEHGNKDALGRIDSIKKNNTLSKKDHEQIAISRIKSQYGSQRGGRPDRFKQKTAPLPPMEEDKAESPRVATPPKIDLPKVNMPEPDIRQSYPGVAPLRPLKSTTPAPRPVSVAPYPEEDGPPKIARPVSVAPYPEDDVRRARNSIGGGPGLRPVSNYGPQADRPSSAFGIRPIHHANTEHLEQGRDYSLRPTSEYGRPSSGIGNMPVGGRGGPPRERVVSAGWEPQVPSSEYRQPGGYRDPSPNRGPIGDPNRPPAFDVRPQDGRSRLQKPLPPNMNKPQPSPYPEDGRGRLPSVPQDARQYDSRVERRDPAANQFTRPERLSSMQTSPLMTPAQQGDRHGSIPSLPSQQRRKDSLPGPSYPKQDRQSSLPPPTQRQGRHERQDSNPDNRRQERYDSPSRRQERYDAPNQNKPRPQPQHTQSSDQVNSRPTSTAPSAASAGTPGGPPKKTGPATFEEMGIPAGKNENDCVRFHSHYLPYKPMLTTSQCVM